MSEECTLFSFIVLRLCDNCVSLEMLLERVQYRSVIRFLFMKEKSIEENLVKLSAVYVEDCPLSKLV